MREMFHNIMIKGMDESKCIQYTDKTVNVNSRVIGEYRLHTIDVRVNGYLLRKEKLIILT